MLKGYQNTSSCQGNKKGRTAATALPSSDTLRRIGCNATLLDQFLLVKSEDADAHSPHTTR